MIRRNDQNDLHLLTIEDVASILRVSKSTVYAMVARGTLEGHRVGRLIRIRQTALDDFLASSRKKDITRLIRAGKRHF